MIHSFSVAWKHVYSQIKSHDRNKNHSEAIFSFPQRIYHRNYRHSDSKYQVYRLAFTDNTKTMVSLITLNMNENTEIDLYYLFAALLLNQLSFVHLWRWGERNVNCLTLLPQRFEHRIYMRCNWHCVQDYSKLCFIVGELLWWIILMVFHCWCNYFQL